MNLIKVDIRFVVCVVTGRYLLFNDFTELKTEFLAFSHN